MLARSNYAVTWNFTAVPSLAIGANLLIEVGAANSGQTFARCDALPYLSLSVLTDDIVEVDVEVGDRVANASVMATLTTLVGLRRYSCYDLPPPFNRGPGFLVVTGNVCRLRVRNTSGNIIAPFVLNARLWK